MEKLVLASGNKGKLEELKQMLAPLEIEVLSQADFELDTPEETGLSFVENAILKARFVAQQTGLPALADDSGLAVSALKGAPGIYSARYAGEAASDQENVAKLLKALRTVPSGERQASFHCVLVLMQHQSDPTPMICQGQWNGFITNAAQGENGFGYDPVFWVPDYSCTSAELSPDEKNKLSHRGQALHQLIMRLQA